MVYFKMLAVIVMMIVAFVMDIAAEKIVLALILLLLMSLVLSERNCHCDHSGNLDRRKD